jgi:hypothetical protein
MPICKNDPNKRYIGTEPSPKGLGFCAHSEKVGTIKIGKDKYNWIVKQVSNGSKRWVKIIKQKFKNYKSYFIHNNYDKPFLVYINKNNIFIYKKSKNIDSANYDINSNKNKWMYIDLVKKYNSVTKIFIGKSILNRTTKFSKGYGPSFDGNSILVQLSKNRYLYIGSEIYEFILTNDTVIYYFSSVGNNDLPYPVIIGNNNIYFMLDKTLIAKNKLPLLTNTELSNVYSYYYGQKGNEVLADYATNIKSVKIIK